MRLFRQLALAVLVAVLALAMPAPLASLHAEDAFGPSDGDEEKDERTGWGAFGDNHADEDEQANGSSADDDAAADSGEEPAEEPKPRATNTFVLNAVEAWAQQANMPIRRIGDGSFRVMTVGRMPGDLDAAAMVAAGEQALVGLETWSGRNEIMPTTNLSSDRVSWAVLLPTNGDFSRFLTWARKEFPQLRHNGEGADLAAQLRSLVTSRVNVRAIEAVQVRASIHYAVYTACNHAVDTWFREATGERTPSWLREGLNAELQRLIPPGEPMVLWRTISYENTGDPMGTDWNAVLREAIAERDPNLIKASWVLKAEPVSLPPVQYVQMWSLCKFIVSSARAQRGERNKFYQVLQELAGGASSADAIDTVYRLRDPRLTRSWQQWAMRQQ